MSRTAILCAGSGLALAAPYLAYAQAGPPFLTNDPGTPGNGNWEINLAAAPTVTRQTSSWQLPQIDLNYGLGDRIQLTYEQPYVLTSSSGEPTRSGWGNAYPGIKWRFLDQGEGGWQASIFPQVETGGSQRAVAAGIASPGPRYLLPIEVTKRFGDTDIDFEYGQYFPVHGPRERIMGLVVGQPLSPKLELDAELYDDRAQDALPHETTLGVGGRYKFHPGLLWLFMVGRSVSGNAAGNTQFMGYFGIQILLSDYGLKLNTSESP
jgi:hypothetical protein